MSKTNSAKRKVFQKTVSIQLPVSNDHGIPVLFDFLAEIQRMYDVEKNIKNNLYAFILSNGLFDELKEYERTHEMKSSGGHFKACKMLLNDNVN